MNALTHGIGFVLALVGLLALIIKADSLMQYLVFTFYGLSLCMMFLSSSLYHLAKDPVKRSNLRHLDHTSIYLLIAGSYTPFLLLSVGGIVGTYGIAIVWLVGVAGIVFKLTVGRKYPKIGVATYALMGWLALFFIYPIYQSLSAAGFTLLLAGGLCYSAGIPLYMMKKRHYSHALWHLAVVAGAACHYFAIYLYVLVDK